MSNLNHESVVEQIAENLEEELGRMPTQEEVDDQVELQTEIREHYILGLTE